MPHLETNTLRENAVDIQSLSAGYRISNTEWAHVHIAERALLTAADEIDRLRAKVIDQRRVNVANITALNLTLERERAQATADRLTLESVRAAHAEYQRTGDLHELARAMNTLLGLGKDGLHG